MTFVDEVKPWMTVVIASISNLVNLKYMAIMDSLPLFPDHDLFV